MKFNALVALQLILVLLVAYIFVGVSCVQYVASFWGNYIKGVPILIPVFQAAIIAAFLGEIVIPAALVTWVISSAL